MNNLNIENNNENNNEVDLNHLKKYNSEIKNRKNNHQGS